MLLPGLSHYSYPVQIVVYRHLGEAVLRDQVGHVRERRDDRLVEDGGLPLVLGDDVIPQEDRLLDELVAYQVLRRDNADLGDRLVRPIL